MPELPPLIAALCNPELHGGVQVTVKQTHISWILLAGERVYKIKKPVDFGFLNFAALEARHQYCLEEVRLNRRLASELYLDVIAITGSASEPRLGGAGPALEYAVVLRRFAESQLAVEMLRLGTLQLSQLHGLAQTLADFHQTAPRATPQQAFGQPQTLLTAVNQCFPALSGRFPSWQERLTLLKNRVEKLHSALTSKFALRLQSGFIRECHGDLHLGNLVHWQNQLIPFDCIEFNAQLRWIDVMSELAFLVMDLNAQGRPDFANGFLNRYLQTSGDYDGLPVFPFYRVYRALVRAKICALSLACQCEEEDKLRLHAQAEAYLLEAERTLLPSQARLFITHGLSGSGKSYQAEALALQINGIHISSDIERKRLAGLSALAQSHGQIYDVEYTEATYRFLLQQAENLLGLGFAVILDASFLQHRHRLAAFELARRLGVEFRIIACTAPEPLLRQRIEQRLQAGDNPSEASLAVLAQQQIQAQALTEQERDLVFTLSQ